MTQKVHSGYSVKTKLAMSRVQISSLVAIVQKIKDYGPKGYLQEGASRR
jgi:hypothetical protein